MSQTMSAHSEDLIPTRYSLLSRLQNWDDQESWKVFFDTYWRLIYSSALKSGLSEAEAQDVVQETIICVAKDINKFKRDRAAGSFKGWLCNLTRWRIADQFRKRKPGVAEAEMTANEHQPTPEMDEIPTTGADELERLWEEEWKSHLLETAVERVRSLVKEEYFQIFELSVIRRWPAGKIAETLNINIARIYLAKHRVVALVKKEIRLLEKEWNG